MNIGEYYLNKKQLIIWGMLLLGLIVAIYLVQTKQIFRSRAAAINNRFDISQDTQPQENVSCEGTVCTTKSLDVFIKPKNLGGPSAPIDAVVTAPTSTPAPNKAPVDSSIGYYIPFRDTSIRPTNPQDTKDRILRSWPNAKVENWDTIVSQSVEHGWNPAFVITLWIEESGAQGYAGYSDALGCEPTNPTTDINDSLRCLFNSFSSYGNERFADLMCMYGESRLAPCTFNRNPNFRINIGKIYSEVVTSGAGMLVR